MSLHLMPMSSLWNVVIWMFSACKIIFIVNSPYSKYTTHFIVKVYMRCFNTMFFCPKAKEGVVYSCLERPQNYQYLAPRACRPMDTTGWWRWWGVWEFTLHHWVHNSGRSKLKKYTQKEGCWRSPSNHEADQRPNSWPKSRQKSSEFFSLLFTVSSTALPCDFYCFKLTQPLLVSTVQSLYSVHWKGGRRKTW